MSSGEFDDKHQVLNHFDGWSEVTRNFVRSEIARIGAAKFFWHQSGYWNSVRLHDASGEFLADVLKTKIWYDPKVAPSGAGDPNSWGMLSVMLEGVTRANRSERSPTRKDPASQPVCPRCQLTHPGDECW